MMTSTIHLCNSKINNPFSLSEETDETLLEKPTGKKYHTLTTKDDYYNSISIFATREQLNQLNGELEKVLYDETYQQLEDRLTAENDRLEERVLELEAQVSRLMGED